MVNQTLHNSGCGGKIIDGMLRGVPRPAALLLCFCWLTAAEAQTNYQRIRSFGPPSQGVNPISRLLEGSDGLLYGTVHSGGPTSLGAVFSLAKDGSGYKLLSGLTNAAFPVGGLAEGTNGVLYGTTENGGVSNYGVIFRLNKDGSDFAILHQFSSDSTDGGLPLGDLVASPGGVVFGTAIQGGSSNGGSVFRVSLSGTGYTNLYFFKGSAVSDGSNPYAGLVLGKDGLLYGTTQNGGSNNFGTVFKLNTSGSGYSVLRHFRGPAFGDGRQPLGSLIQGSDGFLYGTTYYGGVNDVGTLFRLNTNGSSYSVLVSFAVGSSGSQPWGGLAGSTNGTLYGTTRFGGSDDVGTVFKVNHDGSGYAVLHTFKSSGGDGILPQSAPLLLASDGTLYGVTPVGGDSSFGTLYKLFSSMPQVFITNISTLSTGVLLGFSGGAAGQSYDIQANDDVRSSSEWQVVGSVVAGIDGKFQFLDSSATNYSSRFYRSVSP